MIYVQEAPINVATVLSAFGRGDPSIGGIATFVGQVRTEDGDGLRALVLEHYPGMTERKLGELEAEARARWPLKSTLVIHRVGRMIPGEVIVLVATAAAHRADALQACEFLIDRLKTEAPFWKREETEDGDRWIEARSSDEDAARRWDRPT